MTYVSQQKWNNPFEDYVIVRVESSRNHFFAELHIWLHAHCKGKWTTSATRVGFELEEDAMFFKLAWPG